MISKQSDVDHELGIPVVYLEIDPPTPELRILCASDWHLGSRFCDVDLIAKILDYADRQNAYIILGGDMLEMAIKRSKGSMSEQLSDPNEQFESLTELFGKRSDRVLACVTGNHEGRIAREADLDAVKMWADLHGIPYLNKAGVINVSAQGSNWVIYLQHGTRGTGRRPGSSVNSINEMQENVVADLYLHGHHHRASFMKTKVLRYASGPGMYWSSRWFCNTGTMMQYGGYASDGTYPPTDTGCYILHLSNPNRRGKHIRAELLDRGFFGMGG